MHRILVPLSVLTIATLVVAPDLAHAQSTIIRPTLPADGLARRQPAEPQRRQPAVPVSDPAADDVFGAESDAARQDLAGPLGAPTTFDPVGDPAVPVAMEVEAEGDVQALAARYEPDAVVASGEVAASPNVPLDPTNPFFAGGDRRSDPARALTFADLEDQAPESDTVRDRRPARFARFEPYDALGTRLGSFMLLSELTLGGVWQSNALKAPDAHADSLLVARPRLRLLSDWSRHAVEITAAAAPTWHSRFGSEDDRAWSVDARGRLDVTRNATLSAGFTRDVTQEGRSSLNAELLGSARANVTTDRTTAAATTRFGRFGISVEGTLENTAYDGGTGTGAAIADDSARDRKLTAEAVRLSYALRPTLVTFVDAAINQRRFAGIASSDGITRDSSGERVRAGVSFGTAGEILRGEMSVGWGQQSGRDDRLGAVSGLLLNANIGWRVTPLTSLLFQATTEFSDTLLPGVLAGTSQGLHLEARHAFTRGLIGSADLGAVFSDYDGGLREREVTGGAQLEYYLSREMMTFGRWQHTTFSSTESGRGYTADEFGVGVRLAR